LLEMRRPVPPPLPDWGEVIEKEKLLERVAGVFWTDPGLSQAQDIKNRLRCKGWNEVRFIDC